MLKGLVERGLAAEEGGGRIVASPTGAEEVATLLAVAREAGSRVVHEWVRGEAAEGAVALSYARFSGVREVAAADLLAVVEPGTTAAELDDAVVGAGLYWPVGDFVEPTERIGDIVAGSPGAWTLAGNALRRHLLAVEAVLADGTHVGVGSRTVKCVTGYDLKQLFTGSAGTLGILTGLTLRMEALANREAVRGRYERDFAGLSAGPVCMSGPECRACGPAESREKAGGDRRDEVTGGAPADGSLIMLERLKRELDPDGVLAPLSAVASASAARDTTGGDE